MVEKEQFEHPFAVGKVAVPKVCRAAAGYWTVTFDIDFSVKLPDGRQVIVRKQIDVRATEQRGRKPSALWIAEMARAMNLRNNPDQPGD